MEFRYTTWYHHFQRDPVEVCCFRSWGAVGNSRMVTAFHIVGFQCTVILELDYGTFCRKALFISPLVDKSLFPVDFPTKKSMGEASAGQRAWAWKRARPDRPLAFDYEMLRLIISPAFGSFGLVTECIECTIMIHYDSLLVPSSGQRFRWRAFALALIGIICSILKHTQAISGRHVDISNIRTFERLIPHTSEFLLWHWLIAMNLPNRSNSWFGVSQISWVFGKVAMRCSQLGSKASNPTALSSNFVAGMWDDVTRDVCSPKNLQPQLGTSKSPSWFMMLGGLYAYS